MICIMRNKGFTLIEVLIALAIVSIALAAIIQSSSQNIRDSMYLEKRQIADWIGINLVNEVLAGIVKLPPTPEYIDHEIEVMNKSWYTKASLKNTPHPKIQEIKVEVYEHKEGKPLTYLSSYLYVQ